LVSFQWSQILLKSLGLDETGHLSEGLSLIDIFRQHTQPFLYSGDGFGPRWVTFFVQAFLNIEGEMFWPLFNKHSFAHLIPIELKLGLHIELEDFWSVRILALLHYWRYYQVIQLSCLQLFLSDRRCKGIN
jgi:hypothetical protein